MVQLLRVESETERSFDTRAKSLSISKGQDTSIVDFSLDECSLVEVGLNTNFESNTGRGGFGVVDSLGTSLDVRTHAVVVAGMEGV